MMRTNQTTLTATGLLAIGLMAAASHATIFTWTGDTSVDADWSNPANWNNGTPTSGSNVFRINTGSSSAQPVVYDTGGLTSFTQASTNALGDGAADSGYLLLASGTLEITAGNTYVGNAGTGELTIGSGATLHKTNGLFGIGNQAGSSGTLTIDAGGVWNQGNSNNDIEVGKGGTGILNIHGGTLNISNTSGHTLEVGISTGTGLLDLRGGTILAGGSSSLQTLKIGATNGTTFTGNGQVSGYGLIDMRQDSGSGPGLVVHGGRAIADGLQTNGIAADHTLSIVTAGQNNEGLTTVDNTSGSTHFGWYTQNQGALTLVTETINGGGHVYWGDDQGNPAFWEPGAATTVLVNSAYIHTTSANGAMDVALLDPTRVSASDGVTPLPSAPAGVAFMNIWELGITAAEGETEKTVDVFSVRYDESDSAVNAADKHGAMLGFYYWDGTSGAWLDVTADTTLDQTNFLAKYAGTGVTIADGSAGFFALGTADVIPEPASLSLLVAGSILIMTRHTRKVTE